VGLVRFLRRQLERWYGSSGSSHAFVPSQDDLTTCAGCGRTFRDGDHDRRGDTTRPFGAYGGGGGF
jgi:hypothetical protein